VEGSCCDIDFPKVTSTFQHPFGRTKFLKTFVISDLSDGAPEYGIKLLGIVYEFKMSDGDPYVFGDGKYHLFVEPENAGTGTNPEDGNGQVIFPDATLLMSE
jgi:hypothetical protein